MKKPDWVGKIDRYSIEEGEIYVSWKEQRKKVFTRDEHRCKKCGESDRRLLVAHHTSYREKEGSLEEFDLLITLCNLCHNKFHKEHLYDSIKKKHILKSYAKTHLPSLRARNSLGSKEESKTKRTKET